MRYAYHDVPGMTKVEMLNSEALVWGAGQSTAAIMFNSTLISYPSATYNASARPGFDVKPVTNNWCYNPKNITPVPISIFFASTSAGLAASLQQVVTTAESRPEALTFALTFFPYVSGGVTRWDGGGVGSRARVRVRAPSGVEAVCGPGLLGCRSPHFLHGLGLRV